MIGTTASSQAATQQAQFGSAFVAQYGHLIGLRKKEAVSVLNNAAPQNVTSIWVANAIRGLPTNEDLRRTYYWESRRLAFQEMESIASTKRKTRLQRLWRARWFSKVLLVSTSSAAGGATFLARAFAMVQGHRFLWWASIEDFDNGEVPLGQIFFGGHAGLASPSPLELRAVPLEDISRLVSIFGKGNDGQQKLTILMPDDESRSALQKVVEGAVAIKSD